MGFDKQRWTNQQRIQNQQTVSNWSVNDARFPNIGLYSNHQTNAEYGVCFIVQIYNDMSVGCLVVCPFILGTDQWEMLQSEIAEV